MERCRIPAANGQEAIETCSEWRPHIIWMDIRMPVPNGLEATIQQTNHENGSETFVRIEGGFLGFLKKDIPSLGSLIEIERSVSLLTVQQEAFSKNQVYYHECPPIGESNDPITLLTRVETHSPYVLFKRYIVRNMPEMISSGNPYRENANLRSDTGSDGRSHLLILDLVYPSMRDLLAFKIYS